MTFYTYTLTKCPYQVSACCTLRHNSDKILMVKVTTSKEISYQGHIMICHTYTPNLCSQVSTSKTLWYLRYSLDKILKVGVTTARSKVESRTHNEIAHLHPQINVPTTCHLLHLTVSNIQPGQGFFPPSSCLPKGCDG